MNATRNRLPISYIFLAICSVALLFLVGYVIGMNLRIQREASATTPEPTAFESVTEAPHTPKLTQSPTPTPTATPALVEPSDPTPAPLMQLNAFTDRFWQDGTRESDSYYRSPDLMIHYQRIYDTETFNRRVTYYVAEIFVSDVTQIKTASCKDDFSKMGHGDVEKMARSHNAIVAISGDYYGFHGDTLVIRNGTVYRTKLRYGDVCLLLRDGSMETIQRYDRNIDEILAKDPWQAWEFGPVLLDEGGYARTSFPDSKLSKENPRCCIGYVEPGHYFFVVVDGRQKYSKGVTLAELAALMESLGCVQAFNLDGGASAHFYWNGKIVSNPSGGGRQISDIIYIEQEAYPVSPYFCGKDGIQE